MPELDARFWDFAVAQIFNLPYRRFAIGNLLDFSGTANWE